MMHDFYKTSRTLTVVGAQWGDEGKGKIVDYLSNNFDTIVRFQGGNNAGHTIYHNNEKVTLHFIPSGILNENTTNILAQGMVIEPLALLEEIDKVTALGKSLDNLLISDKCHIIMPYHKTIDALHDEVQKIGTTQKGIGPTYTDKVARVGLRMADFLDEETFRAFLEDSLPRVNQTLEAHGKTTFQHDKLIQTYKEAQNRLKPYVCSTGKAIIENINQGKTVLFESAQGTMLCIENGSYPYVTSSATVAANAALGSGIPPKHVDSVLGVIKAYTTRVGEGYFPTMIHDESLAHHIRERGHEYGSTTGRARNVGWLDMVALKHAKEINGITAFVMNHVDVLSGLDTIKLCVAYTYQGKTIEDFPAAKAVLKNAKPQYIELPGFTLDEEKKIKTYDDLPNNAKQFVKHVERILACPIVYAAIGPTKDAILKKQED